MNSTEEYLDRLLKGATGDEPEKSAWEKSLEPVPYEPQLRPKVAPVVKEEPVKVNLANDNAMPSFEDLMQLEESVPDFGDGPIKVGLSIFGDDTAIEPINTATNIFAEEPVVVETPTFEEISGVNDLPVQEEIPELENISLLNDIPVTEDAPVLEDIPVLDEMPSLENVPVVDELPNLDNIPVLDEAPVLDEVPVLEEVSAVDEIPSLEDIPVLDEMTSLEEVPVIDELPNLDNIPVDELLSSEPSIPEELSILENKLELSDTEIGEDLQEMTDVPSDIEALLKDIDNMGSGEFVEPIAAEDYLSNATLYSFDNDTGEIEFPTGASDEEDVKLETLENADLDTLLSEFSGNDSDIAEIGDILSKDENNEIIPELLASNNDSMDVNPAEQFAALLDGDEEEEGGKKKKKKKEKKKKEKKSRKKKGDDISDGDLEEISLDEGEGASSPKAKKKGLFAKIIEALTESDDDLEEGSAVKFEESAVDIAKEGAEENEKLLEELGNEPEDKKGKKKKKKKKGKDAKEGEAASEDGEPQVDKKAEKARLKAEKKAEKAAKKAAQKELEASMPKKKLPKKKVIPVCILCFSLGVVITLLAFMLPTARDKKKALENFQYQNYEDTYQLLKGHKLNDSEQLLYNRTVVLLKEERKLDSYRNYMSLGMKSDALNALVQGVKNSQELSEKAAELGVPYEFNQIYSSIISELNATFGLSEDKVKEWIQIEDPEQYAYVINNFLSTGNADVIAQMEGAEATQNMSADFNVWDNTVISAEEAEFNDSNY